MLQVVRAIKLLTGLFALAVLSMGAASGGNPASSAQSPPVLAPEVLPPGALPGRPVHGSFHGTGLAQPPDVHQLAVTGKGPSRTALLVARGNRGQLCFAVKIGGRARTASFTCLARWDRAPMLLRVGIGGRARDLTDWFALVGLVRPDVGRVTFESQRGSIRGLQLHAWNGFPWKAFAFISRRRGDLPSTVFTRDAAGLVVQEIDLGWVYGSPCRDRHSDVTVVGEQTPSRCKGRRRLRPWSDERDPIADKEAPRIKGKAGTRVKRIVFDHPTVRTLVAGQAFSTDGLVLWTKCKGEGRIGAIVEIRLTKPVFFEGDVPVRGYRASSRTAYVQGVMHVRAQGLLSVWVAVDLRRRAVVGFEFFPADFSGVTDVPQPTIERTIVQQPKPAGAPDSGNCERKRD